MLNTLDGFNVQPRLSIPFDGEIDVHSVSSSTVFLIALAGEEPRALRTIGIRHYCFR